GLLALLSLGRVIVMPVLVIVTPIIFYLAYWLGSLPGLTLSWLYKLAAYERTPSEIEMAARSALHEQTIEETKEAVGDLPTAYQRLFQSRLSRPLSSHGKLLATARTPEDAREMILALADPSQMTTLEQAADWCRRNLKLAAGIFAAIMVVAWLTGGALLAL